MLAVFWKLTLSFDYQICLVLNKVVYEDFL